MSESENNDTETFINDILIELGLKGKPSFNKIRKYSNKVGLNKDKILDLYYQDKEKEDFSNEFMQEEGLKGKNTRIKIMKIIESVGFSKEKIKTAFLRSTIAKRIKHE